APEMFTSVVTSWSDQYCLALTYFKLRTGASPFPPASKPNDIIKCHVHGKLDLSRLPEGERTALARATAVKPESRFPNWVGLVQELERACQQDSQPMTIYTPIATGELASSGKASAKLSTTSSTPEPEPGVGILDKSPGEMQQTITVPHEAIPADTSQ